MNVFKSNRMKWGVRGAKPPEKKMLIFVIGKEIFTDDLLVKVTYE